MATLKEQAAFIKILNKHLPKMVGNNKETYVEREQAITNYAIEAIDHIKNIAFDDSKIESEIDKLMIIRGEHPTRVRNPIYGEERQLAKDLIKAMARKKINDGTNR